MASVQSPLHSDEARGQLAHAVIFRKTARGTTAVVYNRPTGAATHPQLVVRETTGAIMQTWPTLPQALRDTWTAPAAAAGLDPHAFFLRYNWNLINRGEPPTMEWPYTQPPTPIGTIIAWAKSAAGTPALPANWLECNGQLCSLADSPYDGQNLPDLNGALGGTQKFLRGAAESGAVGGYDTVALATPNLPSHAHTIPFGTSGTGTAVPLTVGSKTQSYNTGNAGSGTGHENRPPYYEVVWIIRVL